MIPDDHAMIMPPIGGGGAMSEGTNFIQNSDQVKEQKYISPKNMQHSYNLTHSSYIIQEDLLFYKNNDCSTRGSDFSIRVSRSFATRPVQKVGDMGWGYGPCPWPPPPLPMLPPLLQYYYC